MISLLGIGTAGENIVNCFKSNKEYNCYVVSDNVERNTKYRRKLKYQENLEDYETTVPNLKKFFSTTDEHIQVFLCGAGRTANASLAILQHLEGKKIDIFYIQPDVDLLMGINKLQERAIFGILQQYARSGVFSSFTTFSNPILENSIGSVPIKKYFETINKTIYYCVHYKNLFDHTTPVIGNLSPPPEVQRIRSIGRIDPCTLEESWYFDLDNSRDVCYYICISTDRLEKDGELHKKIIKNLKDKPRNAFKNVSYAIYESPFESDFGFCVAHTNVIQQNTLDKLRQE
tara:strand:- start:341 stop:1204 length:864 start_codon:yes stop_codon:yes gene_type:complete